VILDSSTQDMLSNTMTQVTTDLNPKIHTRFLQENRISSSSSSHVRSQSLKSTHLEIAYVVQRRSQYTLISANIIVIVVVFTTTSLQRHGQPLAPRPRAESSRSRTESLIRCQRIIWESDMDVLASMRVVSVKLANIRQ